MGMYTGLRGKIKLNSKSMADMLHAEDYNWKNIAHILGEPEILEFSTFDRSSFIPHGGSCMTDWEYASSISDDVWNFGCSLKNYEGEINFFIEHVLPIIACAWDLETLYEEFDMPTKHQHNPELIGGDTY